MSNRRCAARTCFNMQGCRPNLKLFPFPKDEIAMREWAKNCGRSDLCKLPSEKLSKFRLCANHFELHWFLNPKYKTRFKPSLQPIPTIFYNNLRDFVPKSLQNSCPLSNEVQKIDENIEEVLQLEIPTEANRSEVLSSCSVVSDISEKMCRLCAQLVHETKLIDIFSQEETDLVSKINKFLPEKISVEDGLPAHACTSCVHKLNDCDEAVSLFISADRKLRTLFHNVDESTSQILDKIPVIIDEDHRLPVRLETFGCSEQTYTITNADNLPVQYIDEEFQDQLSQNGSKVYVIFKKDFVASDINAEDSRPGSMFEGEEFEVLSREELESREAEGCCENEENCDYVQGDFGHLVSVSLGREMEAETAPAEDGVVIKNISTTEVKQYRCLNCDQTFNENSKLLIHEITEHIVEKQTKANNESLVSHIRYRREKMECKECGSVFNGRKPLKKHIREHHIPAENICPFCGAHYKIKSQLLVHLRLHTNEKPFVCSVCTETFHFKKELRRHKRIHLVSKSLMCHICDKSFTNRAALWRHARIHTINRNVLCSQCGKILSNSQSLRVHMRTHSSDRPCSCPTCGKSFKDNASLTRHEVMHSALRNFRCDICQRAFYSKALVKQHKLSHSGVKPHKCNVCGASFNRLGNLNQHKKKHIDSDGKNESKNEIAYECVVCNKRMRSELTLKYHLAKHTGEKKPFDCTACGKRFTAIEPYRVHMRIHTGERPYVCNTCDKDFRSAYTLKQHMGLHKDECPYPCPFCERRFKRLQSLIVHKRTHTGEKPHQCPECGRRFAQKGDMLKHMKTHFRDQPYLGSQVPEEMVLEIDNIAEFALSDTDMTNEFLIDMPIVEVETELH
uniref:Zinc finger protein n=1 Tax=Timema poppense TaxID=170557 RepID=A0A7R9CI34_TIMPO|nr:unnamed protein product [Timema poppensis]